MYLVFEKLQISLFTILMQSFHYINESLLQANVQEIILD